MKPTLKTREPEASAPTEAVKEARVATAGAERLRRAGKSAEDMLNEFEWRFAGLLQIAEATQELYRHVDHQQRWKLGMTEKTADHVFSLWYDFVELNERITRLEDAAWRLNKDAREHEIRPQESLEQPKSQAPERKAFRGPRRVIEPAAGVLNQAKDAKLRDLRDMVEFTLDLEGLFRIFGTDFLATVTLDPSEVVKMYGSSSLFREAIDRDTCYVAAVDLIDVARPFSGV